MVAEEELVVEEELTAELTAGFVVVMSVIMAGASIRPDTLSTLSMGLSWCKFFLLNCDCCLSCDSGGSGGGCNGGWDECGGGGGGCCCCC